VDQSGEGVCGRECVGEGDAVWACGFIEDSGVTVFSKGRQDGYMNRKYVGGMAMGTILGIIEYWRLDRI